MNLQILAKSYKFPKFSPMIYLPYIQTVNSKSRPDSTFGQLAATVKLLQSKNNLLSLICGYNFMNVISQIICILFNHRVKIPKLIFFPNY